MTSEHENAANKRRFNRRRFAFWIGFGLFSLSERIPVRAFDGAAATLMHLTERKPDLDQTESPQHWSFQENDRWYWFERQTRVDYAWKPSGRTRPVDKSTGERAPDVPGYLDDSDVPEEILRPLPQRQASADDLPLSETAPPSPTDELVEDDAEEQEEGMAGSNRRARHGLPPSRWLRSLDADELRVWLASVEVPQAGVSGMSFWVHLTRDHLFDPRKIEGLSTPEQAKLHAAAHYGY